jgi:6-phosphofructokinase 1
MILLPEVPVDFAAVERRVRELYELQQHAVIVVGEGICDEQGQRLGDVSTTADPAGNIRYSGAAEALKQILGRCLGDDFFRGPGSETDVSAIFTRKVGHTQRGGRPIRFDRFYASQLGGEAVDLLVQGQNNSVATLQWSSQNGFQLSGLPANKLRDRWGIIHPRRVHQSLYDAKRFQPSKRGRDFLKPIFTNALGAEDTEHMLADLFNPGKLRTRYQSVNIDIQKRIEHLPGLRPEPGEAGR